MGNLLQQGIKAAKAGNNEQAYDLLLKATQESSSSVQAWIWLSGVVEDDSERLFCLDNALRADPDNEVARRGATTLRQQGIFPAPPRPPGSGAPAPEVDRPVAQPPAPAAPAPSAPGAPESAIQPIQASPAKTASPAPSKTTAEGQFSEKEIKAIYQFVAGELTRKKLPQVIEKELIDRSVPPAMAKKIIASTQNALKKGQVEKYRKQMIRGFLWTVAGAVVTCGSYFFASELGGSSLLCWGAIIFGLIDFFVGLVGWMTNK